MFSPILSGTDGLCWEERLLDRKMCFASAVSYFLSLCQLLAANEFITWEVEDPRLVTGSLFIVTSLVSPFCCTIDDEQDNSRRITTTLT